MNDVVSFANVRSQAGCMSIAICASLRMHLCWRESDDTRMIAMCSRLLAKTKIRGEYVSGSRMREALDAALKLYALPAKKGE